MAEDALVGIMGSVCVCLCVCVCVWTSGQVVVAEGLCYVLRERECRSPFLRLGLGALAVRKYLNCPGVRILSPRWEKWRRVQRERQTDRQTERKRVGWGALNQP